MLDSDPKGFAHYKTFFVMVEGGMYSVQELKKMAEQAEAMWIEHDKNLEQLKGGCDARIP